MSIFDIFNNKLQVTIEDILIKAQQWTETSMERWISKDDPKRIDIRNEMFFFNAWAAWEYCKKHHMIAHDDDTTQQFILRGAFFADLDSKMRIEEVYKLFAARCAIYQEAIDDEAHPQQPEKSIPLYCAIFRNQYALDPTEGCDPEAVREEIGDKCHDFVGHWKEIQMEMKKIWN